MSPSILLLLLPKNPFRMPMLFPALLALSLFAPGRAEATFGGVKEIDVIVKKQPTGGAFVVRTDNSGTVRFHLDEPGQYLIEIRQPPSVPDGGKLSLRLTGETKKAINKTGSNFARTNAATGPGTARADATMPIATGRIVLSTDPSRVLLGHPNLQFDSSGRSAFETITTNDSTDVMLRLSDNTPDPAALSATPMALPPYMSFVSIEGGPKPMAQALPFSSNTGLTYRVAFQLIDRFIATASKNTGTIPAGGGGDSVDITVDPLGLTAGLYKAMVIVTSAMGDQSANQTVPLYLRVLPKTASLPPMTDRKMYFFGADTPDRMNIQIYNANPTADVFTITYEKPEDARVFSLSTMTLTLNPGQTGTVTAIALIKGGVDLTSCFTVTRKDGTSNTFYLLIPDPAPVDTTKTNFVTAGCLATKLYPVLVNVDWPASAELQAQGTLQVYDDCGKTTSNGWAGVNSDNGTAAQARVGNGVKNIKVGLGKQPSGMLHFFAVATNDNGDEIAGSLDGISLQGSAEALAGAGSGETVNLIAVASVADGSPTPVAPGSTLGVALQDAYWLPPPNGIGDITQLVGDATCPGGCPDLFIGDRKLDAIFVGGVGVAKVPPDMDPAKIGILSAVRGGVTTSVAIDSSDAAPSLVTQNINGVNVPIVLKRPGTSLDQTDDGEDNYLVTGSAPPKADDFVAILATGLGAVDANGVVLGRAQVSIGGVPAEVMLAYLKKDTGGAALVYKIIARVPDIPSDSGDSKPQGLVIAVNGSTSGFGTGVLVGGGMPLLRVPFFVSTVPPGLTVKVQGNSYTYVPPQSLSIVNLFQTDALGMASFDVVPLQQFMNANLYVRFDFANWNFGGAAQQTRSMGAFSDAIATFTQKVKITVTGATIASSVADGFYATPSTITLTPSCPAGQMFDHFDVAVRSLLTGNVFANTTLTVTQFTIGGPLDIVTVCKPVVAASCAAVPSGLQGWWGFDAVNSTSFVDLTGNGNNGTLTSGLTQSLAKVNLGSLAPGGIGQVPDSPTLKFGTGPISGDAWVRWTDPTKNLTDAALISKLDSTQGFWFGLTQGQSAAAKIVLVATGGGVPYEWDTTNRVAVADGQWHLLSFKYTPGASATTEFTVDGVVVSSIAGTTGLPVASSKDTTTPLMIGALNSTGSKRFIGDIDEVEIFNSAVTAAQFKAIADAQALGKCRTTPVPIAHTVLTSPPGVGLKAGPDGNILVAPQTAMWVPGSTPHTVDTIQQQFNTANDTVYLFTGWTTSPVPNVVTPNSVSSSVGAGAPAVSTTYTANFKVIGYTATISGCNASIGPLSLAVSGNPLALTSLSPIQLFASPTAGNTFQNFMVTIGGVTTTYTTNPASLTLTGPATITANCGPVVPQTCAAVPSGLVGWWGFDTPNSASFVDLTGNGNSGTITSGLTQSVAKVNLGSLAPFAIGQVPDSPTLKFGTGPISGDVWIRWTDATKNSINAALLSKEDINQGFWFGLTEGQTQGGSATAKLLLQAIGGSVPYYWTTTNRVAVSDGQWHLLSFKYTPGAAATTEFTVDGVVVSSASATTGLPVASSKDTTTPLLIGALNTIGTERFIGDIDEVEIFNSAVTAAQFKAIFDAQGLGKCRTAQAQVGVTVNTDPLNIGVTVGLQNASQQPVGSLLNSYTGNVAQGTAFVTADKAGPFLASNNTQYALSRWKQGTVTIGSATSPVLTQQVTVPSSTNIFTAEYKVTGYKINVVNNNGCTTASSTPSIPADGIVPVGFVITGLTASPGFINAVLSDFGPGSTSITYTPGSTGILPFPVNGPFTLTYNCAGPVVITVKTNPALTGAPVLQVKVDSTTAANAPVTSASLASHTIEAPTPQTVGDIQYAFNGWADLTTATTNARTVSPLVATTYTANFVESAYRVTLVNNGCTTFAPTNGTTPIVSGSFVPSGYLITSYGITPTTGVSLKIDITSNGQQSVFTLTNPQPNSQLGIGGPTILTVTCTAQSGNLNVVTSPPSITGVTGGIGTTTGPTPYAKPVTLNQAVNVSVTPANVVSNDGTGYSFQSWTGGPTPTNQTTASVTPTATPTTVTANYVAVCYSFNLTKVGSGNVTVAAAAPGGGPAVLTGFPINCYVPGTVLTLTATGINGTVLTGWSGDASGTASPLPVTMSSPKNITATFATPTNVILTVTSAPVGLNVRIGSSGAFPAGPISSPVPAGQIQTIDTQTPQVLNGTGYTFSGWSTGGSTPQTTVQPSSDFTATANFTLACYVLTLTTTPSTGGTVAASPASGGLTGLPAACYAPGTTVTLTAAPAQGNALLSWAGATSTTGNTTTVVMSGPKTVTATFGTPASVTLTVTSAPVGLNVRIGASGVFAAGPISSPVPAGQIQTIDTETPQVLNGTGYTFSGWSTGGSTPQTTVQPSSNFTATANFSAACYVLTLTSTPSTGGTVAANPASGGLQGLPAACYAPGTTVTLTASPSQGNALLSWGGATSTTGNTTTVVMSGPKTVTATFGTPASVTLTVTSAPVGLNVRIGSSGAFPAGPISSPVPAGQTQTIDTQTPQVLNGTGYTFSGWSTGGSTPQTTVQPSSNFTATANFTTACYVLTLASTPAAGGTATVSPASGGLTGLPANCYAPGTQVTLTSQPASGYAHNSFGGPDILNTSASTTTFAMNGPKNVKIFFDTVVNSAITIATNPTGLGVTVDGTPGTAPVAKTWAANSSHTLATAAAQTLSGTGYSFVRWDLQWGTQPVGTNSTQASYTATAPSAAGTYTAVFNTACYVLTVTPSPAAGGSVTLNPAAGLSGYSANCYAPGSTVTLTATPSLGFSLQAWAGTTTTSNNTATVVMSGPKTVTATFNLALTANVTYNTVPTILACGSASNCTQSSSTQVIIGTGLNRLTLTYVAVGGTTLHPPGAISLGSLQATVTGTPPNTSVAGATLSLQVSTTVPAAASGTIPLGTLSGSMSATSSTAQITFSPSNITTTSGSLPGVKLTTGSITTTFVLSSATTAIAGPTTGGGTTALQGAVTQP